MSLIYRILPLFLVTFLTACGGGSIAGGGGDNDGGGIIEKPALPKCILLKEPDLSFDKTNKHWYAIIDRTDVEIKYRLVRLKSQNIVQFYDSVHIYMIDRDGKTVTDLWREYFGNLRVTAEPVGETDPEKFTVINVTIPFGDIRAQGFGDDFYTFKIESQCGEALNGEVNESNPFGESLSFDFLLD